MIGKTIRILSRHIRRYQLHEALRKNVAEHGFWFIDIPRTSSTSIRTELGKNFGPLYGKEGALDRNYRIKNGFASHVPAVHMREILGQPLWEDTFTFSLVRNPWDRLVSLHHYATAAGEFPRDLSFREFILQFKSPRYILRPSVHALPHYHYGACDYLEDEQGELLVKFVGRYENRVQDLAFIARQINFPGLGQLFTQQISQRGHYSEYYDPETRDIVGCVYRDDIERFGYSF